MLNRGLPPAATVSRPPYGGLSRRCRRLGWIAEGITYSTHAHRCRSQTEACHPSSAFGGLSRRCRRSGLRVDGRSCSNHRFVGLLYSIRARPISVLDTPRDRHGTCCMYKCDAVDGLQQEFDRNGRTEEGSPVRANAVSVVRGGRNLNESFESAEWRTAQWLVVVSPARTLVDQLIGYRLPDGLGFGGGRLTAGSRPRLPSVVHLRRTLPTLLQVGFARRGSLVSQSNGAGGDRVQRRTGRCPTLVSAPRRFVVAKQSPANAIGGMTVFNSCPCNIRVGHTA